MAGFQLRGRQAGLIALVVLIVLLLVGLLGLQELMKSSLDTGGVITLAYAYTQAANTSPEQAAFQACAGLVQPYLKFPSSAVYSNFEKRFVAPKGNGEFQVNAFVDARNGLGIIMRVDYWCEAKCDSAGKCVIDEWSLAER